jgi:hypothetical protein
MLRLCCQIWLELLTHKLQADKQLMKVDMELAGSLGVDYWNGGN